MRDLCAGCHGQMGNDKAESYHHNLDDELSCLNCHNPHAANGDALLAAKQVDLCMSCHFQKPEFDKPKDQYITHEAQACSACHQPHGSENSLLLKSLDVDLCKSCHSGAHQSAHPIGAEAIDRRTGQAMTCLSCHQSRDKAWASKQAKKVHKK